MKKKSYQIIKIAKAYSFFSDVWREKRDCIDDIFWIDFNITFTNEELDGGRWTSLIWRCRMNNYFCCFINYFKVLVDICPTKSLATGMAFIGTVLQYHFLPHYLLDVYEESRLTESMSCLPFLSFSFFLQLSFRLS